MNIRYQYEYVTSLLKRYGFRGLVFKTLERMQSPMLAYTDRYVQFLPSKEELEEQKKTSFSYAPLISIVVPAYETPEVYLRELIGTVQAQTYTNWELCLADGSKSRQVAQIAEEYAKTDKRIRYQKLLHNGGISENTNEGFQMASGAYIALMDHDDLLSENALYEMVKCLNERYLPEERKMAMIYSDEDKINGDGSVHSRPHFKPDFNLEFLRHNNYFCHFLMFSTELLQKAGGLNKEYDGAQDYDFVLRCVDAGVLVKHIPKILYHWRIHEGSTAGNSADKAYAFDNGCRAIEAHLKRANEAGSAAVTANLGVYHIQYRLQGTYQVTVVSESKRELSRIREYYEKQTAHREYQLQIRYLYADIFDEDVEKSCEGDYILYVKKGIKVKPQGLIETLLGYCGHEHTAIAGAKILTKKGKVSSCGMTYDKKAGMIPLCGGLRAEYKGYFLHAVIPKSVSVLPLACVMIKKDAFLHAGGFSKNYHGIYRDADLCFRLRELSYQILVVPDIVATEESDGSTEKGIVIREDTKDGMKMRMEREQFAEQYKKQLLQDDFAYNCNLSLQQGNTYAMKE